MGPGSHASRDAPNVADTPRSREVENVKDLAAGALAQARDLLSMVEEINGRMGYCPPKDAGTKVAPVPSGHLSELTSVLESVGVAQSAIKDHLNALARQI